MTDAADVLVVGGGIAASAAAGSAARAGRRTVWLEPPAGSPPGDVPFGLLGATDLPADFLPEGARGDRALVDRRLLFLDANGAFALEFHEPGRSEAASPPRSQSAPATGAALRTAAIAAGAEVRTGHAVSLLRTGSGPVGGVALESGSIPARCTILTDGPDAERLADGIAPLSRSPARPWAMAWEHRSLSDLRVDQRFDVGSGDGAAWHALWAPSPGVPPSSGFVVALRGGIGVGAIVHGSRDTTAAASALGSFQSDPAIAPVVRETAVLASGRWASVRRQRLAGTGWSVAGPVAGWPSLTRAVLRGGSPAARSGWLAGSVGPTGPRAYLAALRAARLLGRGAEVRDPVVGGRRIQAAFPSLLATAFHRLLSETGAPKEPVAVALRDVRKRSGRGWIAVGRDLLEGARRL